MPDGSLDRVIVRMTETFVPNIEWLRTGDD